MCTTMYIVPAKMSLIILWHGSDCLGSLKADRPHPQEYFIRHPDYRHRQNQ